MKSKNKVISVLKPRLEPLLPNIAIANAANYRKRRPGDTAPAVATNLKINAALSGAVMSAFKMRKKNQKVDTKAPEYWLNTGRDLSVRIKAASKSRPIDLVCDTCSALVLFYLKEYLSGSGHAELFAETKIHHHYVVVNRKLDSHIQDYRTWGSDAFVVDIWQALFSGHEVTKRGGWDTAHHYKHGIYRNPREHAYSTDIVGQRYKLQSDVLVEL
ncbi:hypothetical protein [Pelagibaculum spongiae]|uniref:Uncharacterized protein n=1 Tax=Pelagibaculum spongiae TaxID=2080658 RepID=A0A2V1GZ08_9GAMM|nr:hypothetical protein [Pelagibaculum spongiae]PVZ70607.1 hypothetical protein DC094_08490 [Pelagibaculum spongiae]